MSTSNASHPLLASAASSIATGLQMQAKRADDFNRISLAGLAHQAGLDPTSFAPAWPGATTVTNNTTTVPPASPAGWLQSPLLGAAIALASGGAAIGIPWAIGAFEKAAPVIQSVAPALTPATPPVVVPSVPAEYQYQIQMQVEPPK